jgi:hypothetical protein
MPAGDLILKTNRMIYEETIQVSIVRHTNNYDSTIVLS